jgi:hypothetical protein
MSTYLKYLVTILALLSVCFSNGQNVTIIHAPSNISTGEYSKLILLPETKFAQESDILETPKGDVVIRVRGIGFIVVAKTSILLTQLRLLRELRALGEKYGEGKLIPVSELSDLSQNEFRRKLYEQYPEFDIGGSSCFSIQAMLQREVRAPGALVRTASAPSKFRGADRNEKEKTYNELLRSAPLVHIRTQAQAEEMRDKLPWIKESVFYDDASQMTTNLNLDRRGLELFQGWLQNELERLDQQIQTKFAGDNSWRSILQGKSAKTADDLMRISPNEFQDLRSKFENDFRAYHFASAQKSLDALNSAQISYRFIFMVRAGLQGLDRRFILQPQG